MSEKTIFSVLRDIKLTENESKVYVFLAKNGAQRAYGISRNLSIHKAQVYRVLKNLESRGIVDLTLEKPTRYAAVPFEKLLELLIKTKRDDLSFLEDNKNALLTQWRSSNLQKSALPVEKFAVIEGRKNIYSRVLQMIEERKRELLVVTTNRGVIQAEQAGIIKPGLVKAEIIQAMEKGDMIPASARVLTQISKENINIIRQIRKRISEKHLNIELRDINSSLKLYPHFYIIDEEEAFFFITLDGDSALTSRQETGLWTNSEAFVCTLKALFEELWHDTTGMNERICEIETEKTTNSAQ
ncbi:MAG: helix-turn-helix domain-containing protein [Candidatus Bathyarchaeia archaeon]